ncbi:hypothetical protein ON010_g14393 [Phytophthora cinnamomi]|nr:hypothetical protein ON010_g14393 [Phytophthora cinnamomi]
MYIFNPEVFDSGIARYQADRLQRWSIALSLFPYVIEHISGAENVWGDLLSRWGATNLAEQGTTPVRVAVVSVIDEYPISPLEAQDFVWPSLAEVRALISDVVSVGEGPAAATSTAPNSATKHKLHWDSSSEIFRDERERVWIPPTATNFQTRLCIVAHTGVAGHRGADTTLKHLREFFYLG